MNPDQHDNTRLSGDPEQRAVPENQKFASFEELSEALNRTFPAEVLEFLFNAELPSRSGPDRELVSSLAKKFTILCSVSDVLNAALIQFGKREEPAFKIICTRLKEINLELSAPVENAEEHKERIIATARKIRLIPQLPGVDVSATEDLFELATDVENAQYFEAPKKFRDRFGEVVAHMENSALKAHERFLIEKLLSTPAQVSCEFVCFSEKPERNRYLPEGLFGSEIQLVDRVYFRNRQVLRNGASMFEELVVLLGQAYVDNYGRPHADGPNHAALGRDCRRYGFEVLAGIGSLLTAELNLSPEAQEIGPEMQRLTCGKWNEWPSSRKLHFISRLSREFPTTDTTDITADSPRIIAAVEFADKGYASGGIEDIFDFLGPADATQE